MIFSRAKFEKLSPLMQTLVLVVLPAPLFAVFALIGALSRGALVWTFSGALLIALSAHGETTSFKKLIPPAAILLMLHLPLVIWDPFKHAPFFGGVITPIALVDYCIDYAFLWSSLKIFNSD